MAVPLPEPAPSSGRLFCLAVAVGLPSGVRRTNIVRYLRTDPLLPYRKLAVVGDSGEARRADTADVVVVHVRQLVDGAAVPRSASGRCGPGFVALVDDPDDLALHGLLSRGIHGIVLADDPVEHVGRAIDAVASGGVWLPGRCLPGLLVREAGDQRVRGTTPAPPFTALTPKELEVLSRLASGKSNQTIAAEQHVSVNTVRSHIRSILRKCGCANRHELLALALRDGSVRGGP